MEYRPLDITLISAEDLKDVSLFSKMDVYAVVSIAGYPKSKKKTFVDKDCGTKPKWNHHMDFIVDEPYLTKPGLSLHLQVMADRSLRGDKEIGEVTVLIHELYQNVNSKSGEEKVVEYSLITSSGKPKGKIKFSYKFGEKFTQEKQKHVDTPMTAYPAPPHVAGGSSMPPPPPPQGMGYGAPPPGVAYPQYPPAPGYGYPPPGGYPPQGYGYPPPSQMGYGGYPNPAMQNAGRNKPGMGMGSGLAMGLGAGLLGGMLVGEMADDAAAYDAGYDDAMGDMGGFDF